jgi:hypothetical protein
VNFIVACGSCSLPAFPHRLQLSQWPRPLFVCHSVAFVRRRFFLLLSTFDFEPIFLLACSVPIGGCILPVRRLFFSRKRVRRSVPFPYLTPIRSCSIFLRAASGQLFCLVCLAVGVLVPSCVCPLGFCRESPVLFLASLPKPRSVIACRLVKLLPAFCLRHCQIFGPVVLRCYLDLCRRSSVSCCPIVCGSLQENLV